MHGKRSARVNPPETTPTPVSLENVSSSDLDPGAEKAGTAALERMRPLKGRSGGRLTERRFAARGGVRVLGAAAVRSPLARLKRQVRHLCKWPRPAEPRPGHRHVTPGAQI